MILSDFCSELEALASGARPEDRKIINSLVSVADSWRGTLIPVGDLVHAFDRTLGHAWLSRDDLHAEVARLIGEVRAEAAGLVGMTLNERLFAFGLSEIWDGASDVLRTRLMRKLEAS